MKRAYIIILVAIVIIFSAFAVFFFGQRDEALRRPGLVSKKAPLGLPKEVKITNIADNAFTVSWITPDKATIGFVAYGQTETLGTRVQDDRDTAGAKPRYTHHVTIKGLDPQTTYFFKIGSDSKLYTNNGKAYEQITAPTTFNPPPPPEPIYGKIVTKDGTSPSEAIIFAAIAGGVSLSSYTRENGNWLITLNNARQTNLIDYTTYKKGDVIDISVQAGKYGATTARATVGSTSPVATISLGIQSQSSAKGVRQPRSQKSESPESSVGQTKTSEKKLQTEMLTTGNLRTYATVFVGVLLIVFVSILFFT